MSGTYERTFSVSVPMERAWRACTDPDELAQWFFTPTGTDDGEARFDLFGTEVAWTILELDPPRRLRYRQSGGSVPQLPGPIETCMTFEAEGTGTRISITHSGFGDGDDWATALESISRGADESLADLVLYLETGVGFARHPMEGGYHGIQAREIPAGLVVHAIDPGTFGASLDLQRGDILVAVGGAPVFGYRELWTVARATAAGSEVTASWIRGGELHHGSASMGPRPMVKAALP
jgi:uncharacterized protein YndB with AHSA1/START domain